MSSRGASKDASTKPGELSDERGDCSAAVLMRLNRSEGQGDQFSVDNSASKGTGASKRTEAVESESRARISLCPLCSLEEDTAGISSAATRSKPV